MLRDGEARDCAWTKLQAPLTAAGRRSQEAFLQASLAPRRCWAIGLSFPGRLGGLGATSTYLYLPLAKLRNMRGDWL